MIIHFPNFNSEFFLCKARAVFFNRNNVKKSFLLIAMLLVVCRSYAQKPPDGFTVPFAVFKDAVNGLNAGFIGLGYEYRPVEFLGFELSGFAGKFNQDETILDIEHPSYGEGHLHSDGNFSGLMLSSKAYLSFDSETYWALYLEYYTGFYAVKAYGEGFYRGYDLKASNSAKMRFLSGLSLGLRIQFLERVDFLASIGGNSIDFTPAMQSMNYNVPSNVKIPTPKLDSFAVFKFGFVFLLNQRE